MVNRNHFFPFISFQVNQSNNLQPINFFCLCNKPTKMQELHHLRASINKGIRFKQCLVYPYNYIPNC